MNKAMTMTLILLLDVTILSTTMGVTEVKAMNLIQNYGLGLSYKSYTDVINRHMKSMGLMNLNIHSKDQKLPYIISEDHLIRKGESHFINIIDLAEIIEAQMQWKKPGEFGKFLLNDKVLYLEALSGLYTNVLDQKKKDTHIASFTKDGNFYVELEDILDYLDIPYGLELNIMQDLQDSYSIHPIPVLMYHLVIDESEMTEAYRKNSAIITKQSFEAQMDVLRDYDVKTITVEDLYKHITGVRKAPENSVLITFDDGYLSSFQYVYPILKERGFQATEFLITSTNKEDPEEWRVVGLPRLSWKEIKKMKDVFSFYSHTHDLHYHAPNQNIGALAVYPKEDLMRDLAKSIEVLDENNIGKFKAFAYPFGHFSETTLEVLRESNIKIAFTTKNGYAEKDEDLLRVDRIAVYPYTTLSQFKKFIGQSY